MSKKVFKMTTDIKEMKRIMRLTKRKTKGELIRDSIELYLYVCRRIVDGDKIFIGDSSESVGELFISTLPYPSVYE